MAEEGILKRRKEGKGNRKVQEGEGGKREERNYYRDKVR